MWRNAIRKVPPVPTACCDWTKKMKLPKKPKPKTPGQNVGKLFPTDLGMVVTDFLKQHFQTVMDYSFTAEIEEEFDKVAEGKMVWSKMLEDFYKPFHANIEVTLETAERAKGERVLGTDAAYR